MMVDLPITIASFSILLDSEEPPSSLSESVSDLDSSFFTRVGVDSSFRMSGSGGPKG